jgi:hypothetical protein
VFSGPRSNYTVTVDGPKVTVTQTGADVVGQRVSDGTDTLTNIERLQFTDQTVDPTPPAANAPATGTVNISSTTPTQGQLLTATRAFSDPNGVNASTIVFSWQAEIRTRGVLTWTTIASGPTFTPSAAEVGLALRAVATFQDNDGATETVTSAPTALVTAAGTPAPVPGPAPAPGLGPADPVLVPGLGGLLAPLLGPDGSPVLRGQVDAGSLAKLARDGVLTVVLEQKPRPGGVLFRLRVTRVGGRAARVAATSSSRSGAKAIATFWRTAPKNAGAYRVNLKSRAFRGLKPGRYVVEVTPMSSRRHAVDKPVRIGFRVR